MSMSPINYSRLASTASALGMIVTGVVGYRAITHESFWLAAILGALFCLNLGMFVWNWTVGRRIVAVIRARGRRP